MPRPDDQCSPGQTLSSSSGQSSERSNSRPFPAKGCLVGMGVACKLPGNFTGLECVQEVQCFPDEQVCHPTCPPWICTYSTR